MIKADAAPRPIGLSSVPQSMFPRAGVVGYAFFRKCEMLQTLTPRETRYFARVIYPIELTDVISVLEEKSLVYFPFFPVKDCYYVGECINGGR
ncbi:hypothetical protein [Sinorhizobium terangae]|uniref:hypothetical protein n=1 Tax=Sinorhizobium terangae TaxID=110322 RepID=UPI003634BBAE